MSNNLGYPISSDVMPPSVPTALSTTYISDNQIDLAWNASVDNIGVSRYRIYRNGFGSSYSTATSYVDKNLQPGVSYTYAVTAIDSSGMESSQSYPVTAKTSAAVNPVSVTLSTPAVTPLTPVVTAVTPPTPVVTRVTLTVSEASLPRGGVLTATWNGIAKPTSTDWIGLYRRGAGKRAFSDRIYLSCSKTPGNPQASGSCLFVVPASTPRGAYELRLLGDSGYNPLAVSNPFAITSRETVREKRSDQRD
jgi:chitodextrinase